MRTTKVVSISLPEAQYKKAVRLAKKENRTMSELLREALRTYEAEKQRRTEAGRQLLAAFEASQEESRRNGTDKMTIEEIDAVIAESRRSRRRLAS